MPEYDFHVDGEGSRVVSLAGARRLVREVATTNTWMLVEIPGRGGAGRFLCEGRGPDLTPLALLRTD